MSHAEDYLRAGAAAAALPDDVLVEALRRVALEDVGDHTIVQEAAERLAELRRSLDAARALLRGVKKRRGPPPARRRSSG